jgi:pheromone a factor receptor
MQSLDPTYPLYSVLSFLGFVVVLIPFSWHLQAWNAGTCAYMFWVSIACLIQFVNSLVWAGNLFDTIPVWCDLSNHLLSIYYCLPSDLSIFQATKFLLGAGVGIVASGLCISRRLYSIASIQAVSTSHVDVSA